MIPHNKPSVGLRETRAINRVVRSKFLTQGSEVAAFEDEICSYLGLPPGSACAVSSGSAALFISLEILNARGKNVGIPTYTCEALSNAAQLCGAKRYFLDCGPNSPNVEVREVEERDLQVYIAVSNFGIPVSLPADGQLKIIEDFSHSFGAEADGKKIGFRGDIGIASLSSTKMFTSAGHGGVIVSRDKNIIDEIRDYLLFDSRGDGKSRFNFAMTEMSAAFGRVQLSRLDSFISKREEIFQIYIDHQIPCLENDDPRNRPVRYRAVVQTVNPVQIIGTLSDQGVTCIVPIEFSELLTKGPEASNSVRMTTTTVSLPIYPSLSLKSALRIARIMQTALRQG